FGYTVYCCGCGEGVGEEGMILELGIGSRTCGMELRNRSVISIPQGGKEKTHNRLADNILIVLNRS
ncbi:MAG: hypothetical protein V4547_10575, partial [Bacteroidota bacterium]